VDLVLAGSAAFLGPDAGGGVVLSNPNGNDGGFLDFGGGFAFTAVNGFTFTAWVRFESFQNSGRILYLKDGGYLNNILLYTYGATRRARFWIKNDGTLKVLDTPVYDDDESLAFFPPAGQWAHVAAVVSPDGVMKLYRDGETRASTSCAGSASSYGCEICDGWTCDAGIAPNPESIAYEYAALGRYETATSSGIYFDGALRDVRLYPRALSVAEIEAIAADWAPPSPPPPPPALFHWWPLNETVGATTAIDAGDGGVDLVLAGGAAFLGLDEGGGVELSTPNGNEGRFLDFGGGFTFTAVGGFTFAAFVRYDSFSNYGVILSLSDDATYYGSNYIILANYGSREATFKIKNGGTTSALFTTDPNFFPPAGAWAHVAVVATAGSPSTYTLYRDGATQGNWTTSDDVAPNPSAVNYARAELGRYTNSGASAGYFDGALRDVRLYGRALDATEIAAIAAD
jgi:hypothetical protein